MDIQPMVILEEIEDIRKALRQFSRGWKNQTAISRIGEHLSAIEVAAGPGHDIRDKVATAYGWVNLLYAPRTDDGYGNTDDIAISLLQNLAAIEEIARTFLPKDFRIDRHA